MNKYILILLIGIFCINFISAFTNNSLNNQIQSYYSFNDASGNRVNDSLSYHNDGTTNGTWVTGKSGTAIRFSSSSGSNANFSNNPQHNVSYLSIAFWINFSSFVNNGAIFEKGNVNWRIYTDNAGKVQETHRDIEGTSISGAGGSDLDLTPQLNNWVHWVHIYNTTGIFDYWNGALVYNKTNGTNDFRILGMLGNPLYLGFGSGGVTSPNASIDEMGIWNRSLTQTEITALSQGDVCGTSCGRNAVLISPIDNYNTISKTINFNISTIGVSLINSTIYINGIANETKIISGIENSSLFTKTFASTGNYTWYGYVCDGNGCETSNSRTFNIFNHVINSQIYNEIAYDFSYEAFKINISYDTSYYSGISTSLVYNGTSYLGSTLDSGSTLIFSKSLNILTVVSQQNKSFYWSIYLTNSSGTTQFNSSINQQTINPIIFQRCNATYPSPVYVNFTIMNETGLNVISALMKATFNYRLGGTSYKNYSFQETNSTFTFCSNFNGTFITNSIIKLSSDGFVDRTFNFNLENYTNSSTTFKNLYMMPSGEGTNIIIQVKDSDYIPLNNYYIEIYRYYPETNSYVLVINDKTDLYGQFVARLIENTVKYKFIFKDSNGVVKKTSTDVTIACKATICVLPFVIEDTINEFSRFENAIDYDWSFTFNNNTNIFTFTWNDVSGVSATNRLYVERTAINGTSIICNSTSTANTGSLTCNVGSSSANYQAQVFRKITGETEKRLATLSAKVGHESRTFGTEGLIWSFFLLSTCLALGYYKPVVSMVLYGTVLILLWMLNIIYLNPAIVIAQITILAIFCWAFRG